MVYWEVQSLEIFLTPLKNRKELDRKKKEEYLYEIKIPSIQMEIKGDVLCDSL